MLIVSWGQFIRTGLNAQALVKAPVFYRAYVEMDEIGMRVIADAALAHFHRLITDGMQAFVAQAYVDCLAVHMQALRIDAARFAAEHRVGVRRAVAGDDFKRFLRIKRRVEVSEHVEQVRIDGLHIVRIMIAQDIGDILEGFREVDAFLPVYGLEVFTGMNIMEM